MCSDSYPLLLVSRAVFQPLGVGPVHVGDDGIDVPAVGRLFLHWAVENDPYGKEVVDAFDVDVLFPYLVQNRRDGLGATLYLKFQPGFEQLDLDWGDELFDIFVAGLFGLVQFVGNAVVLFALGVFEGEVFELGLYAIQSQSVVEGGIQVGGFIGDIFAETAVGVMVYHAHEAQPVGNHDDNHPHIFGEGEQQVAEVVALYGLLLGVESAGLDEPADNFYTVVAEQRFYGFKTQPVFDYKIAGEYGGQGAAVEPYLL